MIYLDTHIVVWLFEGNKKKFSKKAHHLMNEEDLKISPIVRLELAYLENKGITTLPARSVIQYLQNNIGLTVCDKPFDEVMKMAEDLAWTKDPFDRIIVSHAALSESLLITKDNIILQHYPNAVW